MLTKILQRVAAALLCALIVVYIVFQISTALSTEIVTEHAGQNTIEEKVEVTGYVLRDETLINAKQDGVIHSKLTEGARVAKSETIATVYASDTASQVQQQIARINERLSVLEASVIDTNYATSTVAKQDETIYSLLQSNRELVERGKFNLAVQNRSELIISLNKRQLIVGKVTDFSQAISELNEEKARLTANLTDALETITTPTAGYFSGRVDGYESVFTPSALDSMTVNSFYEMLEAPPSEISDLTVGKVIGDFTWHLLCPIERSQSASFTEGRSYRIAFPYSSDTRMNATLEQKIMQTDRDTVVLVFSIRENPKDFNFTRAQTVQIILRSYSGLQIVKSALRQIDGVEGVYVLQGGSIGFKRVNRIHENEGYYLVEQKEATDPEASQYLELYDAVVVRGKELYVGKVVT